MTSVIEQLIREVRRLATESPDNRYMAKPCYYLSGECSDGTIGCIFGQAALNLGITWINDNKNAVNVVPSINF